jgi:hypothetical protein
LNFTIDWYGHFQGEGDVLLPFYDSQYLNAYETGSEARIGIGKWIDFYNRIRPHSKLD